MAIPNKKTIYQDGIILWLAYHLFDVLRQVSVFQQIRNISKWVWDYQFKKKNPNASKEEHDNAWREHRPFTSGIIKYRIKSATRTVLLLICNIFEYILWFSVVYIFMYKAKTPNVDSLRIILESITTLANIASPEEVSDYEKGFDIAMIAYIESVIGIFMNIVCLARFIPLLPPVQTIDDN